MGVVRGVVFDESALLIEATDDKNESLLLPGAEFILRMIFRSKIRIGISYAADLPETTVSYLKRVVSLYSIDFFVLNEPTCEVMPTWGDIDGSIVYLVSNKKKVLPKLSNYSWVVGFLNVGGESSCDFPNALLIEKLEELPFTICHLNKKLIGPNVVTLGYKMKPSRVEDFAKRGAFPLSPTPNGLMFMPLGSDLPLSSQLKEVDIVLHKATDEILSIKDDNINFTESMQELQKYFEHNQDCCVLDPLINIYPLLDRLKIQKILLDLVEVKTESKYTIRGAHFLMVDNFDNLNFVAELGKANLSVPCIVKPKVACGISDAHKMAIIFRADDLKNLDVPLPAIIQEYVDHSSTLYKFYMLGEKIFYAVKKSIPNANILMRSFDSRDPKPLEFDSLKSLPTADNVQNSAISDHPAGTIESIDLKLVTDAAHWLRRRLQLTIFGFDVVIQEGTHDHVIVDVNYLPSFKEVPDEVAIPAFWEAVRSKFDSRMLK